MADEKKRYPAMSAKHWQVIRRKFRSATPREVTLSYLSSLLNMTSESARANILPTLKITGIVDKDGKPTERATRWRDDAQYPQVCEEIRQAVYPSELLDLGAGFDIDRSMIQNWFANHTGFGEDAARKFASFYLMLANADPSDEGDRPSTPRATGNRKATPKITTPRRGKENTEDRSDDTATNDVASTSPSPKLTLASTPTVDLPRRQAPSLHVNVQIHISPESSPEQIDQIFASMAKHLRDFT